MSAWAPPAAEVVDWSAYDWLPDPVVVVGADRTVRHVNALAARLLCRPTDRLLGAVATDVLPLVDDNGDDWWAVERPLEADARLLARIPERELLLHTPDHVGRPVTLAGARVRQPDGTWLVLTLRRAERRRRIDAARSDLVATVSHELRSPLTAVKGFTKTLLAKWDRFSDEQKKQMLETVNADADRVTRLLSELLDVSRIDSGRLQLRRRMVAVQPLAERVIEALAVSEEEEARIEVAMPEGLPEVYADADKLQQVLTNLLENAVKYGEGSVGVSAAEVGGELQITVSDQGGRITDQHLRHLFTKFYRRAEERRAGTGLGLYISKGIVEAHGGRVWAESAPELGTRFHVTLPLAGVEIPGAGLAERRGKRKTYAAAESRRPAPPHHGAAHSAGADHQQDGAARQDGDDSHS